MPPGDRPKGAGRVRRRGEDSFRGSGAGEAGRPRSRFRHPHEERAVARLHRLHRGGGAALQGGPGMRGGRGHRGSALPSRLPGGTSIPARRDLRPYPAVPHPSRRGRGRQARADGRAGADAGSAAPPGSRRVGMGSGDVPRPDVREGRPSALGVAARRDAPGVYRGSVRRGGEIRRDQRGRREASAASRKYPGIRPPLHPLPLRCAHSPYFTVRLSRAPRWRGASTLSMLRLFARRYTGGREAAP